MTLETLEDEVRKLGWLSKCPLELCLFKPKDSLENLEAHWNSEHSWYFGQFPKESGVLKSLNLAIQIEDAEIPDKTKEALKELRNIETEEEALSFYSTNGKGQFLFKVLLKQMYDSEDYTDLSMAIERLSTEGKGEDIQHLLKRKKLELWRNVRELKGKQQPLRSDVSFSEELLKQVESWDETLSEGRIPDTNFQFSTREEAEKYFARYKPYEYRIYKRLKPYYKKGEAKPQIVNPEIRQGIPVCPYGYVYDSAKQICIRIETRYPTLPERKSKEELSSEKKLSSEDFIKALVESKSKERERNLVVATSLLPKEEAPTTKKEFDIGDLVTLENLREQRRRRELRKESGE